MRLTLRRVFFSILLITAVTHLWAQSADQTFSGDYLKIYEASEISLANDALLQNGIYYAYPYYNAVGHPFMGDGEFEPGSIVFREKRYDGISINYDIFNQQIILSRKMDEMLQMNLLANEFISGFTFKGKHFIKADFHGGTSPFYQVISQNRNIACYYTWYRERREVLDSGNQRIFSFDEQKSKHYLVLDGKLLRYKNNRSFIQLIPEDSKEEIKDYLKENQVLVKDADDQVMSLLIEYCNSIMDQNSNHEGE